MKVDSLREQFLILTADRLWPANEHLSMTPLSKFAGPSSVFEKSVSQIEKLDQSTWAIIEPSIRHSMKPVSSTLDKDQSVLVRSHLERMLFRSDNLRMDNPESLDSTIEQQCKFAPSNKHSEKSQS
jgi:hypothetical protein